MQQGQGAQLQTRHPYAATRSHPDGQSSPPGASLGESKFRLYPRELLKRPSLFSPLNSMPGEGRAMPSIPSEGTKEWNEAPWVIIRSIGYNWILVSFSIYHSLTIRDGCGCRSLMGGTCQKTLSTLGLRALSSSSSNGPRGRWRHHQGPSRYQAQGQRGMLKNWLGLVVRYHNGKAPEPLAATPT